MRLITVSGPPSSGKTSVVIRAVEQMGGGEKVMVVKFDCLSSTDQERYQRAGIRAVTGLSGNQCPDHFYISNVEDCAKRAQAERRSLQPLRSPSEGLSGRLCDRQPVRGEHAPQDRAHAALCGRGGGD